MNESDYTKYKDVLGYEPSSYQTDIFDFITHGTGNCVITARAGSGKTSTIVSGMKLVPEKKKCLFLAFNKSIAEELSKKLLDYSNCTVKTVHSLGFSMLKKYMKSNGMEQPKLDDFKYRTYLRNHMEELSDNTEFSGKEFNEYVDNVIQLLNFSRTSLAQTEEEIADVADKHNIMPERDEISVVKKLMDWGSEHFDVIDYTDMVWLPVELNVPAKGFQYDWVFNDEAQDYSVAYVKLFMKCFKRGTRFVSCGDDYQSINQFAGASEDAFDTMKNYRNTQTFTLPISYRCDKEIIKEARNRVKDIEPRPNAESGIVINESHVSDIKENDMVLCRTNAPLFKLFIRLIDKRVPCYIKGKDDDKKKLLATIENYSKGDKLSQNFESDGLFPRLYANLIETRNKLVLNGVDISDANTSAIVMSKYDTISTLLIIANGLKTKQQLVSKIESIFSKSETGVCLSTVHKAKGLEADNVHILCRSMMPSKSAKTKAELEQEMNIIYVAVTRARHKLCYVSEEEFPPTKVAGGNNDSTDNEFKYIESMVCKLYNTTPITKIDNVDIAAIKTKNTPKVVPLHTNDNKKVVEPTKNTPQATKDKLMDMLFK